LKRHYTTNPGRRYPAGATVDAGGTNFSVFSRHATDVELLLFDSDAAIEPFQIITLDPEDNRTFFSWHVYVEGLKPGVYYAWRVNGPHDPAAGMLFDPSIELLDPYARCVGDTLWVRPRPGGGQGRAAQGMRAMVVSPDYDWEGDQPLDHAPEDTIIYELHVGGFTRHPSAATRYPGTFRALIEKIPYLVELGITDVELMPVTAFDERDLPNEPFNSGLRNYWGYCAHSFFCPHPGYCVTPELGTHCVEFKDMVKALHRAGIGVILDIVINHTAEGGEDGPIINFKGLANDIFYHLDPKDKRKYRDFTGCGNTVNCNHPFVARFILQCLEFWVKEMHVDGFRFDLASVLARGETGEPMAHPPVAWNIEFSDALAETSLIAEAWDAAGLYQVGAFPGFRWAEWNGRYRDVMRRFLRGDGGLIGEVATRITGSSDLYQPGGRLPTNGVNFITCHDGFTLNDLVSYNEKHNEANREGGRDGTNDNLSWNSGCEGETDDPGVCALRARRAKNFIAVLLLSQGVPMILAGDEVLRTQRGNNNAYCQDNELSWFDWRLVEKNRDMVRFVREMIAFRKRHPCLRRTRFLTGRPYKPGFPPDIVWHGAKLFQPNWNDPNGRFLAFSMAGIARGEESLHVMLNMSMEAVEAEIPEIENLAWFRAVDTGLGAPGDIAPPSAQTRIPDLSYTLSPHSVAVLEARPPLRLLT
jgi:glycogen operon protein